MTKDKKKMHRLFLYVGALILFIIIAVLIFTQNKKNQDTKIVACTQEAKLCPDGSSVYRYGPQCQFAECPIAPEPKVEEEVVVKKEEVLGSKYTTMNKKVVIAGMSVTPLEVVEDSRCPSGVNCIWKGTVRVKVKLESVGNTTQTTELSFGNSVVFGDKKITLISVNPPAISNLIINKADYVFEFSVSNNAKETVASGTLDGTMTIGPICPVERMYLCNPSVQMFAERKVAVFKGDPKILIKTLTPDANGRFSATLPAGVYYVELVNPVSSPTTVLGVPATVTIQKNTTFHIDINIDTGIR